jgi:cytochrome P450
MMWNIFNDVNVSMLAGTVVATSVVFLVFAYRKFFKFPTTKLPGPPAHWLLGNLIEASKAADDRQTHKLLWEWSKKYGKVYRVLLPFGDEKLGICISDAEVIKKVLFDDKTFVTSPSVSNPFYLLAPTGVLVTHGEEWKRHRKIVTGAFAPVQLQFAVEVTNREADLLVEKWKRNIQENSRQSFDFQKEFANLTLDILGEVAFSHKFNLINGGNPWTSNLHTIIDGISHRTIVPKILWPLLVRDSKKWESTALSMRDLPKKFVEERRQMHETHEDYDEHTHSDLLERLVQNMEGESLSNNEVVDETMLFFLAGHETTTSTLSWISYMIQDKEEVKQKIRREYEEIIGDNDLRYEDLPKLVYLEAVIKETLRMKPTAPLLARHCTRDTEINGYKFPAGSGVVLMTIASNYDPENYPEPEVFKPERWLNKAEKHYQFSFGDGPKICVGQKLAMIEMKVTISKILRNFDMNLTPGAKVTEVHSITLGPKDGLLMQLTSSN